MATMNGRERKVLKTLEMSEWEFKGSLYAGEITLASLLKKGWIEKLPATHSGLERFKITEAGQAALDEPVVPSKRQKPKIHMLKPPLRTMDTRTVKPKKRER